MNEKRKRSAEHKNDMNTCKDVGTADTYEF